MLFRTSFFVFLVSLFRKLEDDMSKKYTLADFCKKRGITPEWLASKDGNLEIDSRTRKLPDDELIVGGSLTFKNCAFSKFPDRVVVGGKL